MATNVTLVAGGGGIFDVQMDNELVYSKHATGVFPDDDGLVIQMRETIDKSN